MQQAKKPRPNSTNENYLLSTPITFPSFSTATQAKNYETQKEYQVKNNHCFELSTIKM